MHTRSFKSQCNTSCFCVYLYFNDQRLIYLSAYHAALAHPLGPFVSLLLQQPPPQSLLPLLRYLSEPYKEQKLL